MDTKIIDVLVGRDSDTEAVIRAMTALDDYGGEYEVCPDTAENVWKDREKMIFPRAVYRFTGKYRYRIYIWCTQDLIGSPEKDFESEKEKQIVGRFLEAEERVSHVIVCVDMQKSSVRERQDSEENADCSAFMGKIFL